MRSDHAVNTGHSTGPPLKLGGLSCQHQHRPLHGLRKHLENFYLTALRSLLWSEFCFIQWKSKYFWQFLLAVLTFPSKQLCRNVGRSELQSGSFVTKIYFTKYITAGSGSGSASSPQAAHKISSPNPLLPNYRSVLTTREGGDWSNLSLLSAVLSLHPLPLPLPWLTDKNCWVTRLKWNVWFDCQARRCCLLFLLWWCWGWAQAGSPC